MSRTSYVNVKRAKDAEVDVMGELLRLAFAFGLGVSLSFLALLVERT